MTKRKVIRPVVYKLVEEAKIPTKVKDDGGFDLYSLWDKPVLIQPPGTVKMFNTGLKMMFPTEYVALFRERGSTGILNLQVRAGVVEGNNKGEYIILLSNGNEMEDIIYVRDNYTMEEVVEEYMQMYPHLTEVTKEGLQIRKDSYNREVLELNVKEEMVLKLGYIYPQSKAVAQMVIVEKEDWDFKEVTHEEFSAFESDRGEGKLGSSGK